MHGHRWFLLILITISIMNCVDADHSSFKITTKQTSDKVEARIENDLAIFSVRSPRGISQARIQRTKGQWPQKAMFRLHLRGLESFMVNNGKFTLKGSISSHGDPGKIHQWIDEQEGSPLDAESPYWIDARMCQSDGTLSQTILQHDGYFELRLPKALFDENPDSIVVSWIDFYR